MIRLILGGLGFFALLAAALYFGLSGIPAGDSRNRKDAETNAHGRREFLFDDAQDFDDAPLGPDLALILDAIREEERAIIAAYYGEDVAAIKRRERTVAEYKQMILGPGLEITPRKTEPVLDEYPDWMRRLDQRREGRPS